MAPFLTALDSRAEVKGSRDPLGIQSIWSHFGRHVVGNLTTVTTSVRDFTVLLLGFHFAEQVEDSGGKGTFVDTFLKWEQLANYARASANGDWVFRGTERVKKFLNEDSKVTLSAQPARQILGSQRTYGIWGLYTMPSRASGLLEGDPLRLSAPARDMVESYYLPMLTGSGFREGRAIAEMLSHASARIDVKGREEKLSHALGRLLRRKYSQKERDFYTRYLVEGGPQDISGGRQRQLAELFAEESTDIELSPSFVRGLCKEAAHRRGDWQGLVSRLERIRTCESLVAPSSRLFSFLLAHENRAIGEVVNRIRERWGSGVKSINTEAVADLGTEVIEALGDREAAPRWLAVARALSGGDYDRAVTLLLEQNAVVMANRGGSGPWAELRRGRLAIRFRDESGDLPTKTELAELWRHPYFLDSLRTIVRELKGEAP
jgi:hypothetical protein